jgi:hypothetical protein
MSETEHTDQDDREGGRRPSGRWDYLVAIALLAAAVVRRLFPERRPAERPPEPPPQREEQQRVEERAEPGPSDKSQQEWLGAKWSSWGCLSVLGSLAIAGLAVVTVLYGIFTIPTAFGPAGLLSPDPALIPPFEPPPDRERLIGVPPIGVPEFTTGHTLRLADGVLFTVTRTALDWSPSPPRTPEVEYTVVDVRLVNDGQDPVQLSPEHFRMVTARGEVFEPLEIATVPNSLVDQTVRPGATAEGTLVFARPNIQQVRRYLIYDPPFRPDTIRILLVP